MAEGSFDERKIAILEAALLVFSQKGYKAATNKEIAQEAGITAAALYWYFPSKEELFRAVVEHQRGKLIHVGSLLELLKDLPPEDVLKRMVLGVASMVQEERHLRFARLMISELSRDEHLARVLEKDLVEPMVFLVRDYLAYQMKLGRLRSSDPGLAAQLFVSSIMVTIGMRSMLHHERLAHVTDEQLATDAVTIFLKGLQ